MKWKCIPYIFASLLLFGVLSACGGSESADGIPTEEFTYWLSVGESSQFYTKYENNPVMEYIMKNKTFKNKDGAETRIKFTFQVPAAGKEVDTYNTLISTNTFLDIMDMSFGMPIEDMYEAGQVLDITYYVENHMPNYMAFLNKHPELMPYVTKTVNGERKFLQLTNASDVMDIYNQFCGICYRRDWIVTYGSPPAQIWSLDAGNKKVYAPNPNAGIPFSYHYSLDRDGNAIHTTELTENVDPDSWMDNVVFPSGNTDPIYISDWEWMMEIFARALQDQNVNDGYVMSLYYPGYVQTGEIMTGFGGGGPLFYIDRDSGTAAFGASGEGFKAYMQCLNQWYKNGWIDKEFQDKTDMFFQIDENKIYQGKIGLWVGAAAHLGARTYSSRQPLTEGVMVFGGPQPINDVYGPDSAKFREPYVMFQSDGLIGGGICVTNKAADKDLFVLFDFLDYLFSEEGSILRTMGMNQAQLAESGTSIYQQFGITDSAYTILENGKFQYHPVLEQNDGNIRGALTLARMPGMTRFSLIEYRYAPSYVHWRNQWVRYEATGFLGGMFNSQMTQEESGLRERISTILEREYMHIEVPKFITGALNFEEDYKNFLSHLERRRYQSVLDALNETIKRINNI